MWSCEVFRIKNAVRKTRFRPCFKGIDRMDKKSADRRYSIPKQARYQLRYTRLLSCIIRLGIFSQMWRGTSSATPGYSVFAIRPRRRRKSKIFLSVVIPVVKAAFQSGLLTRRNPANARVPRLSGLPFLWSWMKLTALPNVARYQLRYTRIFSLTVSSRKADYTRFI